MIDLDLHARLCRPWAMEPSHAGAFIASLVGIDAMLAKGAKSDPDHRKKDHDHAAVADGVATLLMRGPMLHRPPAWLADYGVEYTDTLALANAIAAADADPAVKAIRILADSPGGEVGGVETLADAIQAAAKPVTVAVDGMLASAAYWVASQADTITASPASEIGSIGVYTVAVDLTRRFEDAGVRVHLISSGGVKGVGTPGTPITPEALASTQAVVDQIAARFVAAVRAGRPGISIADDRNLASGKVWLAPQAADLGLIDAHGTRSHQPAAPAAHPQESTMDFKAMNDLAAKHPQAAATIIKLAAEGLAADAIEQHLAAEAAAAEKQALADKAAAADKKAADLAVELEAAKAELAKLAVERDQAKALAEQSKSKDAGPAPKDDTLRRSQMDDNEKGKFIRAHGSDAFFALPL